MGGSLDWISIGIGAASLLASIVGVIYAFLARQAAKSAEGAARDARKSISQTLCLVSAQRALSVIATLNTLHRSQHWEAALEVHRELRTLLNDVSGTVPQDLEQSKAAVIQGIGQLSVIEDLVGQVSTKTLDHSIFSINAMTLATIQATLETLVRELMPTRDEEGGTNG